jgi:hypothetical protein
MRLDILKAAFDDELRKIAAVRSGRRPISAHKLLAKKTKKKVSTLIKEAIPVGTLGAVAIGALGTKALLDAKNDWQRGRVQRIQAQQALREGYGT